mgnify:FL=1
MLHNKQQSSFSTSLVLGVKWLCFDVNQVVDHEGVWKAFHDQGEVTVDCRFGSPKNKDTPQLYFIFIFSHPN